MKKILIVLYLFFQFSQGFSQQFGCVSGNCENGYGTYVFSDGGKYEGNWLNKKRNGLGTNYWANGEWYRGENKDDLREGQGTYFFSNGSKYEGQWKANTMSGYGTLTSASGNIQKGLWEKGIYVGSGKNNYGCISGNCETGYGVYTWDTGEQYEGDWVDRKRNGNGINTWASGEQYAGGWKDDKRNGFGKQTYTNGTVKTGFWENGTYTGEIVAKSGCISGDCQDGKGIFVETNGDKYEGQFKNGLFSGQGTFYFIEGDKYIGDFKDGNFEGQGIIYFVNSKEKYVGSFANGKYNGSGTYYYEDGWEESGLWKDGEFSISDENLISKPEILWLNPEAENVESDNSEFSIKLCVKSKEDLRSIQIFINDDVQITTAIKSEGKDISNCEYIVVKNINLKPGDNKIRIITENSAGKAESSIRTIKYTPDPNLNIKRLALVIGNSNYIGAPLKNPVNDASAMGKELKSLGFEVMQYVNLSQKDMIVHIREFGEKLKAEKGVGLFFYAGHGIQARGENYLIPVDAEIQKEQDIELEAVNLARLMGEFENADNGFNIVILDACRDNPFAANFRSMGNKGLAATSAPTGTYIAYSTAPGSVASDGDGENGIYTQELLKAIMMDKVKIEDVFKEVRKNVLEITKKAQTPWENSSITGDFYFKN